MEFVFGFVFVCFDMNSVKKVIFDDKIMKKLVIMEGDFFDLVGILIGGIVYIYLLIINYIVI